MPPDPPAPDPGRHPRRWQLSALAIFAVAGGLFATTALTSNGLDLRESSVTDLDHVVRQERDRVNDLQAQVASLNQDISRLGKSVNDEQVRSLQHQVEQLRGPAGFTAVRGPGLTVSLDDASKDKVHEVEKSHSVPLDALVIHQQDIQAVVNALWAGGAEAISIKDVRIISTTGIKCVGNTVVLYDVPYSPPYTIKAIGDPIALQSSLDTNEYVRGIAEGAIDYGLGYDVTSSDELKVPAFEGSSTVKYAEPAGPPVKRSASGPDLQR